MGDIGLGIAGNHHGSRVVIDHGGHHTQDSQAVIGAAILGALALLGAVHDVVAAQAFRKLVLRRIDIHGLRFEPVVPGKGERQAHQAGLGGELIRGQECGSTQCNTQSTGLLRALRQRDGYCVHQHVFFRCLGQHHAVAVDHQITVRPGVDDAVDGMVLKHPDRAVVELHHHAGRRVVGHVGRDVLRIDALVFRVGTGHRVDDQTAMALQVVTDNRHFLAVASAHVEGVAALTADDLQRHTGAGVLDEEAVIALQRINRHLLQTGVGDVQTGTINALVIDHEVVTEFGADDSQGVKAVATVDTHRGVDGIGNKVSALATVDVGVRCLGIVRVDLDEGTDGEGVVVLIAIQEQLGLVAVDREVVVTRTAVQHRALADAIGQEAGGDLCRYKIIFRSQTVVRVAAIAPGLEHLTNLEDIVAGVTINRGRCQVVVQHEGVVAIATKDFHRAGDIGVVVDALDDAADHRQTGRIHLNGSHHANAQIPVGTQQEVVALVGAINTQAVDAGVIVRLVKDIDARGNLASQPNLIQVTALLTM